MSDGYRQGYGQRQRQGQGRNNGNGGGSGYNYNRDHNYNDYNYDYGYEYDYNGYARGGTRGRGGQNGRGASHRGYDGRGADYRGRGGYNDAPPASYGRQYDYNYEHQNQNQNQPQYQYDNRRQQPQEEYSIHVQPASHVPAPPLGPRHTPDVRQSTSPRPVEAQFLKSPQQDAITNTTDTDRTRFPNKPEPIHQVAKLDENETITAEPAVAPLMPVKTSDVLPIVKSIPIFIPEIPKRDVVSDGKVKKKTLMKFKKNKPKKKMSVGKEVEQVSNVMEIFQEEPETAADVPGSYSVSDLAPDTVPADHATDDLDSLLTNLVASTQQLEETKRRRAQTDLAFDADIREELDVMDVDDGRLIDKETNMFLDKMIKSNKDGGSGGGSSNLKLPEHPISHEPFLKKFYKESEIISNLTNSQVARLRKNDSVIIRGKHTLKPVVEWNQLGFPLAISNILQSLNFQSPTPIQCEALPHIMDGRDFIGIAKTGSGKTIAFLLPMLRQLFANHNQKNHRGVGENGETYRGATPRALILTPTRELAIQIAKTAKPFADRLGVKIVKCYGGQSISAQIAELKSGNTDIIVGTPGRIIDLLCTNNGRILSLSHITYLVMDEADRMFDLGFEPQMIKILGRTRTDRQSVLFSATFPPKIQQIAREILLDAVEVKIGDNNVVSESIKQHFEVVKKEEEKLPKLLNILGQYYDADKATTSGTKILIFMEKQNSCDSMVKKLIGRGYAVMALHGGKDQGERDGTIKDFKKGIVDIIVATSIASRGLDVEGLNLVINYDAPSHIEDYVHRVGRTGRAGRTGDAFTIFLEEREEEEKLAYELNRVMSKSLSEPVIDMANRYAGKLERNEVKYGGYGGGFSGKGLEKLRLAREQTENVERAVYLGDGVNADAGADDDANGGSDVDGGINGSDSSAADKLGLGNVTVSATDNGFFAAKVPLQALPQAARWWAASHETTAAIAEQTHCTLVVKGTYGASGSTGTTGDEPLHMAVSGGSAVDVERAVRDLVAGIRKKLEV